MERKYLTEWKRFLTEDKDPTDRELGTWALSEFGQSKIPKDLKQAIEDIRRQDTRDQRTYPSLAWDWVEELDRQQRSHLTILYYKWEGVGFAKDDPNLRKLQ